MQDIWLILNCDTVAMMILILFKPGFSDNFLKYNTLFHLMYVDFQSYKFSGVYLSGGKDTYISNMHCLHVDA